MSKLAFLNQTSLRIYSYKYRSLVTPLIVIVVCFMIFTFIIIPLVQQWFINQEQIVQSQRRIGVLTNNLTFAGKINDSAVDKYLQLVSKALPSNKDFIGILAAISAAAIDSSISLNDYQFQVGDISGNTKGALSNLQVTITINGSLTDLKRFAVSLKKQLPLSTITEIRVDANTLASVTIQFFYKPYPDKISFQPAQPLQTLTAAEQKILQQLVSLDASTKTSALSIQERLVQQ